MSFTNDKDEYKQSNQQLPASPSKPLSVLTPPMSSPASLKRSFADTGLDGDVPKQSMSTANALTQPPTSSQACSPSPSPSRALTTSSVAGCTAVAGRPEKRAKLTFAEKEARRVEKQFKEQQKMEETKRKEEEKAKRCEEKARKDEEKRARDVEKEERKKLREDQAKAKEVEKQKKLEEKQKAEEEKDKKARVFLYKGTK